MPPQGLTVTPEEAGQKLLQFLARRFDLPQAMFHRWIRTGQVRRNGGRCKPFDRVETGDIVRVPPFAGAMARPGGDDGVSASGIAAASADAGIGADTGAGTGSDTRAGTRAGTDASAGTYLGASSGADMGADTGAGRGAPAPDGAEAEERASIQHRRGAFAHDGSEANHASRCPMPSGASASGVSADDTESLQGAADTARLLSASRGAASPHGTGTLPGATLLALPRLVYSDADLFLFDKPAGLAVHPGTGHDDSLATRLASNCAGAAFRPTPAHRLDKDTSGLLLVARSYRMLRQLHDAFASREGMVKEYLAWVAGNWNGNGAMLLRDRLAKKADGRGRERMSTGEGAEASCTVQCLHRTQARSLLLIRLHTGRTHQIRVQLADRGHPIVGDRKYGGPPNRGGLMLHAVRLRLPDGCVHVCLPQWTGEDALPVAFALPALES